ncbi:hypothetical protein A0257_22260 [Hymenobacter psoromatis]|nr:hypothetical protein A0257_22260 [Hymenobacter psoromatis]
MGLNENKGARLSARDMFSPETLSKLQTDFAEAMQPFALERGVKGSRAKHKTMRQMYALGGEKAAELAPLVKPNEPQPYVLPKPPLIGRDEWQREKQAEINAEIARQVRQVNERLGVVGAVAVAASGAAEQSERSRTWASDSLHKADAARAEMTKEINQAQAERERHAVERERHTAELNKLLMQVAQGNLPADLLKRGQELAAQQLDDLRQAWPVASVLRVQADQAERAGDYGLVAELRYGKIPEAEQQLAEYRVQAQATPGGRALLTELEENDRAIQAMEQAKARQTAEGREQERLAEQERQAQERAAERARYVQEQAAQEQRAAQEEEARKAQQEAIDKAAAEKEVAKRSQDTTGWSQGTQNDLCRVQISEQQIEDQEEEYDM